MGLYSSGREDRLKIGTAWVRIPPGLLIKEIPENAKFQGFLCFRTLKKVNVLRLKHDKI